MKKYCLILSVVGMLYSNNSHAVLVRFGNIIFDLPEQMLNNALASGATLYVAEAGKEAEDEQALKRGSDMQALVYAISYTAITQAASPQVITPEQAKEKANKELFSAVHSCSLDQVKKALEKGADVNAKNSLGNTPLMEAAQLHVVDGEGIKWLDQYDIESRVAALKDIIKFLLQNNADKTIRNKNGNSAWDYAIADSPYREMLNVPNLVEEVRKILSE